MQADGDGLAPGLLAALDCLPVESAVLSGDGRVQAAAPLLAARLGLAPDELRGRDLLDLVHPHDRPAARRLLPPPADRPVGASLRVRSAGGGTRWVRASARRLPGAEGTSSALLLLVDLADEGGERERLARAAARDAALVELQDALTGVGHDVAEVAARAAGRVLGGWSMVWLREGDGLVVAAAWHERPAQQATLQRLQPDPLPLGTGIAGVVAATGTSRVLNGLSSGPPGLTAVLQPYRDWMVRHRVEHALAVPMLTAGDTVGVLSVARQTGMPPFEDADVELAQEVAQRIAASVLAQRQAAELGRRQREVALVLDSVPSPLAVLDERGALASVNAAWRALADDIGRGSPTEPGTDFLGLLVRAGRVQPSRRTLASGLRRVLDGELDAWDEEVHDETDGRVRWFRAKVAALPDGGAVVILPEITDLKQVERTLSHQASHDPLTGLPNRTVLEARLLTAGSRRALLFLDVDDFKTVNDSYGHPAGDALLVEVAARLRAAVPPGALLARFAGDEFVVLCEDVLGEVHALGLADTLLGAFVAPFEVGGTVLRVTASVGVALSAGDGSSLLGDADAALFEAKARGRARHALSDERTRVRTRSRLETTQALRRAVEDGQLVLHHQPVVDLGDGRCRAVEALLRWQRPGAGLVHPAGFLAVAEEAGLAQALAEWVVEEAVRQAAAWAAAGTPLAVNLNLSPRQLVDPRTVRLVAAALGRHALSPTLLRVEVTESAALDSEQGERALRHLQELGVGVAVDDFGTGYSSLARLRHLPGVDTLKVDRSFVRGVTHVQDDREIVTAVLRLAQALGLAVVAEGVETTGQRDWLAAQGCEMGQGWLFGTPLPAAEMGPWLRAGARWSPEPPAAPPPRDAHPPAAPGPQPGPHPGPRPGPPSTSEGVPCRRT